MKVLDRWIRDLAENSDEAANRTRRGLSYVVVAAVLAQLREDDGTPLFVLKGGVAMQLRFGPRARLSKDYDAAFRRRIAELETVLADAPSHPVGGFLLRAVGKPEPIGPTGAFRQTLKLTYAGKPWATVPLEVSEPEGASAALDTLDHLRPIPDPTVFGLDEFGTIEVMPVLYQMAQKIHACTEVREDKENERFTDLLDLQLLAELIAADGWSTVRDACVEVFSLRQKHSWPPGVTIFQGRPEGYERTALENGFPVTSIESAVAAVESIIERANGAT